VRADISLVFSYDFWLEQRVRKGVFSCDFFLRTPTKKWVLNCEFKLRARWDEVIFSKIVLSNFRPKQANKLI
jgi:hypothetical protein